MSRRRFVKRGSAGNKRKINALANTRLTTSKIVWHSVDPVTPGGGGEGGGRRRRRRAEVEKEVKEKVENRQRKLIDGYLLNRTERPRNRPSESVFVHCLADLIANINMFYLPSNPHPRPPLPRPFLSLSFHLLLRTIRPTPSRSPS